MFDILMEDTNDSCFFDFKSIRLWRMTSRKTTDDQKDQNKGVIFDVITPSAFDLRPSDKSVSLNKLKIESHNEDEDSLKNRKVMTLKIVNAEDTKMASIFISKDDMNSQKLREDPETKKLLGFIEIKETVEGEFSYKGIDACHYDLFYLSKDGKKLVKGDAEFGEGYIINTKRLISEIAKIPTCVTKEES